MSSLYYSSKSLQHYQRIINKYSPIPTTLSFHDKYDNTPYYFVQDNKAHIEISTFYSTFFHFPNEGDRDAFHSGTIYRYIGKLLYSNYDVIHDFSNKIENSITNLRNHYKLYWKNRNTHNATLFKNAFLEYARLQNIFTIFDSIEQACVENAIYLNNPLFTKDTLITRCILADYAEYNISINNSYNFISLLDKLHIFVTYAYKDKNYCIHHEYSSKLKHILLDARLNAIDTKDRLVYASKVVSLLESDMLEYNSKVFDNDYNNPTGYIYKIITTEKKEAKVSSAPTSDDEQLEKKQELVDKIEALIDAENKSSQGSAPIVENDSADTSIENPGATSIHISRVVNDYSDDKVLLPTMIEKKSHLISEARQNAYFVQKKIFHKKNTVYKTKLEHGTKLDPKQLYRGTIDGKIFRKSKKAKNNDIIVSILIDSSYSMEGIRRKNAIDTSYKLGVLFHHLKIPYSIHSHSVGDSGKTELMKQVSFKECKNATNLDRLFHLQIHGKTQEYIALKQSLVDLSNYKRGNQKGLVIVISDAETDNKDGIKSLCIDYKNKHNIDVLAIAVGKLTYVQDAYINYLYLPTSNHFFQDLVSEFERLMI